MIKLSIDRPSILVVIFTILMVLGFFSFQQLSYELIPKFSAPLITVATVYPGASPAEVENSVTRKLEDALSSLENIRDIYATSLESYSVILVNFEDGVNVDLLLQDAQRKLNQIQNDLPDDAQTPLISKFSSDEIPIMNIGAVSTLPPTKFYDLMKDRVKPGLSKIKGVGQINLIGGEEREIRVNIRKDKLEQLNISLFQVQQAIQQANLDFPTGKLKDNNSQVLIRLAGKFTSLDDLRNVVVSANQFGAPVHLHEVAEIVDAEKEITDINRVDGISSIGMYVLKQSDANAVDVTETVKKELTKLEAQYKAEGLQFSIANNTSDFTIEAVDAVQKDIFLAIVLVAAVMLLFLHSLRNAGIVLISIPVSLVTTFVGMYVFGFTFNLMTLLAMSLVIGILVDDSIVVLENIYRHLEMGKPSRKAALDGSKEIFLAALSITLVIVVVFFPLALTSGIVGNIMRQFSLVVVMSTLLSLLISYTITPALAARFSRKEHFDDSSFSGVIFGSFERGLSKLTEGYVGILRWSLNHKAIVLIVTGALFLSSFTLVTKGFIGSEFITNGDRGEFIIQVELPKDATIQQTNQVTQQIEAFLFDQKEVTGLFTSVGAKSGFASAQRSPYIAEINVKLVPKEQRSVSTALYSLQTKNALTGMLPGVEVTSSEVAFFGGANDAPIQIIMSSADIEDAKAYADKMLTKLKQIKGTLEPEWSLEEGNPEVRVQVDRERLSELGLTMAMVGGTLQTAFSGNTDAKYKDGNNEYDINIVLDEFDRRDAEDIAELTVMNPRGQLIKLSQIAEIKPTTGPARLERTDRIPSVKVQSKVLGVPSGTIGEAITAWVAANPPPAGVSVKYDGDLRNQAESFSSLGLAFLASILFVYLIMVALYDSYIYPLVVMFSLPVALVGALLALALAMQTLNIFTILGIIMLIGLVAKNAILLVDFAILSKEEGHDTYSALIEAGRARLRPILMTTLALVIGMIPIAIAKGAGSEWKNGLAWVLIGGLTSSMFLTLVVVPVVYIFADKVKEFFARLFGKKKNPELAAE
ncbi:MAG: efflux RND transporter permease subunit [Saprospiraceae bacterium]|nr:efflux RND transporter permease subunit [Saprospiraceae bacterium]